MSGEALTSVLHPIGEEQPKQASRSPKVLGPLGRAECSVGRLMLMWWPLSSLSAAEAIKVPPRLYGVLRSSISKIFKLYGASPSPDEALCQPIQ